MMRDVERVVNQLVGVYWFMSHTERIVIYHHIVRMKLYYVLKIIWNRQNGRLIMSIIINHC